MTFRNRKGTKPVNQTQSKSWHEQQESKRHLLGAHRSLSKKQTNDTKNNDKFGLEKQKQNKIV